MATLAFCGLGRMGEPMAARLLEAGHDLVVWNRSPGRATGLVARGARLAASPAEAVASADAVVTMLATPEALEAVVFGPGAGRNAGGPGSDDTAADRLASGLRTDTTLIEMSTVGPDVVRDLAERLPEGVSVLDAPVLGSVPQATDGSLKIFVGGSDDVFERWCPVLEILGRPVRFGPLGSGAAMKLVANSTLGAVMSAVGEALALADGLGLNQALVLDTLAESPVGATVSSKRALIESGEYQPNFALALAAKDLRLVDEAARRAGIDAWVAAAARAHFDDANRAGLGDLDYSAVIAHVRAASDRR
ncbi:MAG: NAD(P)-dependent oxidoreductase [Actinomycetota bacterium]|nr:NAD(P)-dependent oxidoreductase [Actinomycetota bacterium]